MNLGVAIAVYATISMELGVPLRFPGTPEAYRALYQVSAADLMADATVWAGRSESAQDDIFNLTNGDQFRWHYIWPHITRMFDMEIAEPVPTPPASYMTDKADLWASIMAKYCLQNTPYEKLVAWNFADFIFRSGFDNVSSTIKVRKADFNGCIDSEEMFRTFFHQLRAEKVIP
ncbi:hypothetical protein [Novosphingobium sp.]|uniref:hypothetical protein n=1 Tax=Novosphingobium sp. TaxID=1874826 RepID=UPI0031E31B7B